VAATTSGVGSPNLRHELSHGTGLTQVEATVSELESAGRTAVVVVVNNVAAGLLGLADQLRPDARDTVAALSALTGKTPILLTGDNPRGLVDSPPRSVSPTFKQDCSRRTR
jgi:cation transport ATPase